MREIDINALEKVCLPLEDCPSYIVKELCHKVPLKLGTSPDYAFGSVLNVIAQLCGGKYHWENETFTLYPQFYTALLGNSGTGKSAVLDNVFKPLYNIQLKKWNETPEEERLKNFKPLYVNGDVTLERFQEYLAMDNDGSTVLTDELLNYIGNWGKYNSNKSTQEEKFLMECHARYKPYTAGRKNGDRNMKRPIPRIIGGTQIGALKDYFKGANLTMLKDGFLNRLLFCTYNNSIDYDEDESVDISEICKKWEWLCEEIYKNHEEIKIVFSKEADDIYKKYKKDNKMLRKARTLQEYEYSLLAKLEIYIIEIAMVMSIIGAYESGQKFGNEIIIPEDCMRFSLRCVNVFRKTGMDVYDAITEGNDNKISKIGKYDYIRLGLQNNLIVDRTAFSQSMGVSPKKVYDIEYGRR